MNQAQAQASGTKPGQLDSTIPGQNEENSTQVGIDSELKNLAKETKKNKSRAPSQEEQSQPSDAEQAFLNDEDVGSQQPQDDLNPISMIAQAGAPLPQLSRSETGELAGQIIEQGIPTATSIVGRTGGAVVGAISPIPGGAIGGEEAGGVASSALNVAMAPINRDIANKVREFFGTEKNMSSDDEARFNQAIIETVGHLTPGIIDAVKGVPFIAKMIEKYGISSTGEAGVLREAQKLADKNGAQVADNIKTAKEMQNMGILPDTSAVFKGTELDPNVQLKNQNPNISNVEQAFIDHANVVGNDVDKNGKLILSEENVTKQRNDLGSNIGDARKELARLVPGQVVDPAPLLQAWKEELNRMGIKSENGMVTSDQIKNLSSDQKAVITKMNNVIERLQSVHAEDGTTLSTEMLKHEEGRDLSVKPNFNGATDQNAGAQFQDVIPPQPMNLGAPMEVSGASNPLGVQTDVTKTQGVQGSLGLEEQSDILNKVVAHDQNGNPITRAQALAQSANSKIFQNGKGAVRGMDVDELHQLTKDFQKAANFGSATRTDSDKVFGSLSNTLSTMRDEITRVGYENASKEAFARGDSELGEHLAGEAERMKNMNERFHLLATAQPKLIKALKKSPDEAVNYLMKSMDQDEFDSLIKSSDPETIGSLKNMYIKNLVSDSSKGGVLINPKAIQTRVYNDGSRLEMLFGKEGKAALDELVSKAQKAEIMDKKGSDAFNNSVIKSAVQFITKSNPSLETQNFIRALFARAPNVRNALQEAPSYINAFEKFYGKSNAERISNIAPTIADRAAKKTVASGVVSGVISSNREKKQREERNKELNMLDLENK